MKNPYGYMSMANQAGNSKQNGGATNGGWGATSGNNGMDFGMSTDMGMSNQPNRQGQNRMNLGGNTAPPPGRGEPGPEPVYDWRGAAGGDPMPGYGTEQGGGNQGSGPATGNGQGSSMLRPYQPYPNTGIYPAGDYFTGQTGKWWDDSSNQAAAQAYTNAMSPLYTIQEGGRQFNATELEGARRFDAEFGRTDRNDLWGQGFSERQQTEAERVAMEAENQWNQDFEWGKSQDMFGRGIATGELDLARLTQAQRNALDTGELNLAKLTQAQRNALDTGQLSLAQLTQQQRNAVEQGQLGLANRQQTENNAIEKGQLALSQLTQQQRNAVESGQLNLANLTQQQKNAIEQAQLAFQQRQENNRYAIDQGQLSLANRTQTENLGMDRSRLSLDTMTQNQLNAYRNQQLSQEAALSRENMKNQMAMQTMQAFGRTQAPNVRFMRNWG